MTQEEKQLLLKDLCARQFYGVKAHYRYFDFVGSSERLIHEGDGTIKSVDISIGNPIYIEGYHTYLEDTKPYLRPMSSMTEEEEKEIQKINWQFCKSNNVLLECFVGNADDGYCSTSQMAGILDYLNAHRFDYRGLIEKGLALEAPEEMYKIE